MIHFKFFSLFLFFFFIAELFIGTWDMTKELQDPRLTKVAESLPFLIQSSWAESTNDKYRRGWNNWSKWCEKYPEAGRCPADTFCIALFFNEIVISKQKLGYLTTAHSGMRWGHLNAGHRSPTEHPFARMASEGARKLLSTDKEFTQKESFTLEMFAKVFGLYGNSTNLIHSRFLLVCLLGISGFLRISELLDIQIKHISFHNEHMEITVPKSKTDQLREGHVVFISRTRSERCPVSWTEKYLSTTGLNINPENHLVSCLAKTKKGHNAIGTIPVSYTRNRESFLELLSPLSCEGWDKHAYGLLASFRRSFS